MNIYIVYNFINILFIFNIHLSLIIEFGVKIKSWEQNVLQKKLQSYYNYEDSFYIKGLFLNISGQYFIKTEN